VPVLVAVQVLDVQQVAAEEAVAFQVAGTHHVALGLTFLNEGKSRDARGQVAEELVGVAGPDAETMGHHVVRRGRPRIVDVQQRGVVEVGARGGRRHRADVFTVGVGVAKGGVYLD